MEPDSEAPPRQEEAALGGAPRGRHFRTLWPGPGFHEGQPYVGRTCGRLHPCCQESQPQGPFLSRGQLRSGWEDVGN